MIYSRVRGYQVENQYLASHGKCNVNCVSAKIPLFSHKFKQKGGMEEYEGEKNYTGL